MPTPAFLGPEHVLNTMFGEVTTSAFRGLTPLANGGLMTNVSAQGGHKVYTHTPTGALKAEAFLAAPGAEIKRQDFWLTGLQDGRVMGTWNEDRNASGTEDYDRMVQGRLYNADGTFGGAPFRVDEGALPFDRVEAITTLANGNTAISYRNSAADSKDDSPGIFVRFFNAEGAPLGASINANTVTQSTQIFSSVAGLANGSVVVMYEDSSRSESHPAQAIRGTVITQAGTKVGFLAQSASGVGANVDVAALVDGRFVATWTTENPDTLNGGDNDGLDVVARIFNPDGSAATTELKVNGTRGNDQFQGAVTGLKNGGFAVAFTDESEADDPKWGIDIGDVKVQLFDKAGNKDGAEIRINTTVRGDQFNPDIAELADGRLAVAWTDETMYIAQNTRLQILDPRSAGVALKGTKLKDEFVGTGFADTIGGGLADDCLAGGAGKDAFLFETALTKRKVTNVDAITDFSVKDDSIWLENKIFKKIGSKGSITKPAKLDSDMFTTGTKARDAEDRVIYDKKTGNLWYDADGTGAVKAVQIATLTKNLRLTDKDFFVI